MLTVLVPVLGQNGQGGVQRISSTEVPDAVGLTPETVCKWSSCKYSDCSCSSDVLYDSLLHTFLPSSCNPVASNKDYSQEQ